MKIFIAYKFSGQEKSVLREELTAISSSIEEQGHTTTIFFRDVQDWGKLEMPVEDVMLAAYAKISNCDALFAYIGDMGSSRGMCLEAGFAKGQNKKLIVAYKKDTYPGYIKHIADTLIEYRDLNDLLEQVRVVS